MIAIQYNINDRATPALRDKLAMCEPHRVATRIAPVLARHWRDSLAALPRNRQGYPSTGFWEDAARSVTGVAIEGSVLLSADKLGLRQRLYGGAIKKKSKMLTIPITAEAYGTTSKDWGDALVPVIFLDSGKKFLALWFGTEATQKVFTKSFKGVKKSEGTTRRAHAISATLAAGKPKAVFFRDSKGGTTQQRAERHMNLKFMFVLKDETAEQAANPLVVPQDLGDVALAAAEEAVK